VPKAQAFGDLLGGFLKDNLKTVMQITKVMLLNATLMKATGTGVMGWGAKIGGKALGFVKGGGGAAVQAAAEHAKATAAAMVNITAKIVNVSGSKPGGTVAPDVAARIKQRVAASASASAAARQAMASAPVGGSIFSRIAAFFVRVGSALAAARPALLMIMRLTLVGAVLVVAIKLVMTAVEMIASNAMGVVDTISNFWEKFKAQMSVIGDLLQPVTDVFSEKGVVGKFFMVVVAGIISGLTQGVDAIMHMIQTIILVVKALGDDWAQAMLDPIKTFKDKWEEAARLTAIKQLPWDMMKGEVPIMLRPNTTEAPGERAGTVNDFRGSKFDITQKFAEGFDPDRIAVAFTNDLAALGERAMQSQFTSIYAVR